MKHRITMLILVLGLVAGISGCFPESEGFANMSLQLSLKELGLEDAAPQIRDWQDWYDSGGRGSMVFDLGLDGRGFYLGLYLEGIADGGELAFGGQRVHATDELLTVDLVVSQCTECRFSALIFWEEQLAQPVVSTFSGTSSVFNVLPGAIPEFIDLHVYLAPTGSIRCLPSSPDFQGQVTLAALDTKERVIFPSVTAQLDAQGIVLPNIPVSRQMNVLIWSTLNNEYDTEPVSIDVMVSQPGEEVEVDIGL